MPPLDGYFLLFVPPGYALVVPLNQTITQTPDPLTDLKMPKRHRSPGLCFFGRLVLTNTRMTNEPPIKVPDLTKHLNLLVIQTQTGIFAWHFFPWHGAPPLPNHHQYHD